jgi:hypothetical protein
MATSLPAGLPVLPLYGAGLVTMASGRGRGAAMGRDTALNQGSLSPSLLAISGIAAALSA